MDVRIVKAHKDGIHAFQVGKKYTVLKGYGVKLVEAGIAVDIGDLNITEEKALVEELTAKKEGRSKQKEEVDAVVHEVKSKPKRGAVKVQRKDDKKK